ncbi:hypothetical protein WA026_022927 [Henosepilachna vigintioctopunctata]|uniref:Uncharacterized protein n=1 Tax=Henosepilachna vigintioctopunctata TaxID=420089 RepID=A0AAW1U051_9CUCU
MDLLMSSNLYLTELVDKWHRSYQDYTLKLFSIFKPYAKEIFDEISPETFTISGHLVPLFKAISSSESSSSCFGPVTPYRPDSLGPDAAHQLYVGSQRFSFELELPNIPQISIFTTSIIHTDNKDIPDYTNPFTFDNTENITIYGSQFRAEHWTRIQKDYILNPVTSYSPESTADLDYTFNMNGKDLGLPIIGEDDSISSIEEFLTLSNTDWLTRLTKIFATYSSFKDSSTLADCSPTGPQCSLVSKNFVHQSSANVHNNTYYTISHAFTDTHPFTYQCSTHRPKT